MLVSWLLYLMQCIFKEQLSCIIRKNNGTSSELPQETHQGDKKTQTWTSVFSFICKHVNPGKVKQCTGTAKHFKTFMTQFSYSSFVLTLGKT